MRTLLSALAVGLFVLVAAPQNALACHRGTPHGMDTSCPPPAPTSKIVFVTSDHYDGALEPRPGGCELLEGVAAGECICQHHATAAGLAVSRKNARFAVTPP